MMGDIRDFRRIRVNEPKPPEPKTATIGELITECRDSSTRMGTGNPNRNLLLNCANALEMLCDRLSTFESPDGQVLLGKMPVTAESVVIGDTNGQR